MSRVPCDHCQDTDPSCLFCGGLGTTEAHDMEYFTEGDLRHEQGAEESSSPTGHEARTERF